MPIQVNEPKQASKVAPAVALGVLLFLGFIIATRWRALIFVLVIIAAGAGFWLAK
ncbi:hypothetical protein U8C35_06545 [Sinorhizobium medicae]|uniref:hypothetical protein n=1 Tax=Sinorhizobium medicae TaxID=110321 RepID=UPI002AF6AED2|nr:hypothetical protein [Sinorhizobium medicae]WQO60092.1 hypothetical protein U8C35_06545 [Sinorhizobium medicae]